MICSDAISCQRAIFWVITKMSAVLGFDFVFVQNVSRFGQHPFN